MKNILLLSDLHQRNYVLKNLEEFFKKKRFDAVLVAGDLTDRNPNALDYAKKFEELIKKNSMQFFYLFGNCDSEEVINYFTKKGYSIHLKNRKIDNFQIAGIGGFGEEYPHGFNIKNYILVTHFPPIFSNKTFKDAPLVHIFGHTHFWEYQKKQGKTLLVQLRAALLGRAGILNLPSLEVKFLSFKK